MPLLPFMLANLASALVWATGILAPGLLAMVMLR
jgi:membrane protein DedA with SNARE-associated domain